MLLLHGDVGDAIGVAIWRMVSAMSFGVPENTAGVASISSSDRSGRNRRTSDRSGIPELSVGSAITERFSSSSSKRSPAASRMNAMRLASGSEVHRFRGPARQPDDVGPLRGEGEQLVAVARDEDRNVGCVLVHVFGDVTQPRDAFARVGYGSSACSNSSLTYPAPRPRSKRPPLRSRSDVTSRASSAGR